MTPTLRAVYENGHLKLLDPVNLQEGQQVEVMIVDQRERMHRILGDLLAPQEPFDEDDDFDEEALMREIEDGLSGPPLSETIIEERRNGP